MLIGFAGGVQNLAGALDILGCRGEDLVDGVDLVRIGQPDANIGGVDDSVAVAIIIAAVSDAVSVAVLLESILGKRTVVD